MLTSSEVYTSFGKRESETGRKDMSVGAQL